MRNIYLFDWGNTLMTDFPKETGKMCDWKNVEAIDGALATLEELSRRGALIYVATNAGDSSEYDIQAAFFRVALSPYIQGYYCKANLGIGKGTPEFFQRILQDLNADPKSVIMTGDTYNNDIEPALEAGIQAVWFNPEREVCQGARDDVVQICYLSELLSI